AASPPLRSEATIPLLESAHGAQEVDLPERRPVNVAEVELAVRALPEQEPREPHLAARSNDQVGIGKVGRVEVPGESLLGDALDDRLEVLALLGLLAKQCLHRVDDLLAPAVGDSDRQRHLAIGGGGLLGLTDRGDHRVREGIELADGADPAAETAEPRVTGGVDAPGPDRR